MFNNVFKRKEKCPLPSMEEKGLVFAPYMHGKIDTKNIERAFARLFSTADGKAVLMYLQSVTFQRALGAGAPDEQLRYMEGQRSMVATILRLVERGRSE